MTISGSVEIRAFGAYIEEFISAVMKAGIKIVDLRNESGIFYFTCARVKYRAVAEKAREYGICTKLICRKGAYFKVRPYFKRYGALLGVMGYFLVIHVLSGYVWDITVTGNETVTENQIVEILSSSGIGIGTYGRGVDTEYAELTALLQLKQLAWINVEVNGSRVDVKLSERTISDEPDIPVGTPCNVIALRDGVIVETEVYRGTLTAGKGSGVSKGDIIVSGTVEDGGGNILLQHADAKIIAECEDTAEFFAQYDTQEQKRSGKVTEKQYAVFLGNEIPLFMNGETPENSRYSEEVQKAKFLCFYLPFRIKTCRYEHLETVDVTLTSEMVLKALDEKIELYKVNLFSQAEITDEKVEYYPEENGIRAKLTIRYKTDIACKEPIIIG